MITTITTITTLNVFSPKSIVIGPLLGTISLFFIANYAAKNESKLTDQGETSVKTTSKSNNPSGEDDNKDSWRKGLERHYVKIIVGVVVVSGLCLYAVHCNTFTQKEYIYSITTGVSSTPKQCLEGTGLSFEELKISKEIFPPYVNLIDHSMFKMQRNFGWVANTLVQIEDKILMFNAEFKLASAKGLCQHSSSMPGYQEIVFLERHYFKIMSSDNPFQRAITLMNLLYDSSESAGGFKLQSLLMEEDLYKAHKGQYVNVAKNGKEAPYSQLFE